MKGVGQIRLTLVWLAVVGLCIPQAAMATSPPADQKPVVTDVRLQGGYLLGQVVTAENVAVPNEKVLLASGGQVLVEGTTNGNGMFAFKGLQQGVYQVVAAKGHQAYRVWPEKIAPPSAQPGALIVAGNGTVRGQLGMRGFRNLLANPWVVAAIVATAIAVPVAIHNRTPSTP